MPKQNFYIIGHNPNTVESALAFLKPSSGVAANALGPDILYNQDEDTYYLFHPPPLINWNMPTAGSGVTNLGEYLEGLRKIIKKVNLALIAWDIKVPRDTGFDINHFMQYVHDNFSSKPGCSGVAMLASVADIDDIDIMTAFDKPFRNYGVGVDEHGAPKEVEAGFRNAGVTNYTYGYGSSLHINKPMKNSVRRGLQMKASGNSFKLVYAWTVNDHAIMIEYLTMGVDGMIVDLAYIGTLGILLIDPALDFKQKYQLAKRGSNPFAEQIT